MRYFTDGSCKDNGGENSNGGFGIVVINDSDHVIWEYQEFKKNTTNNEMELMAILTALNYIKENETDSFFKPIIYTDSAYCLNTITTWMYNWAQRGWKRDGNQPVKNLDIIKQIYELAHLADIRKVKGHTGNKWNEYADSLATGKIKLDL